MDIHQKLIDRNAILQVAIAGAGTHLVSELWRQPGSSAYLAGATLLQARHEMENFIGFAPDAGYCSKETAIDMAFAAYIRAVKNSSVEQGEKMPIGIALTAAVASNRIPKGEQRAHLVVIAPNGVDYQYLQFDKEKGETARLKQDRTITKAAIAKLAEVLDGKTYPINMDAFERLRHRPIFLPNGKRIGGMPTKGAYFPANFNPFHEGHRLACQGAENRIGAKVHFMLEACPPNKPAIPTPELLRRIALLQLDNDKWARAVMVTIGQPTYIDKARAHPGSRFIAGADAVERLLLPTWGYDVNYMLEEMDTLGTKFYVLGRQIDGQFKTVDQLDIPTAFKHLFEHLDGFQHISSTELRTLEKKATT